MLGRADFLDGIPILTPGLRLAGLQEAEVGLVVRIDTRHDFDIRAEFIFRVALGEIAIPRVAELVVAPGPLLLAGRDVVVGDVDDARLRRVVVAAKEILLAAHAHVGRGHWNVGVERQVVWLIVES